MRLKEEEGVSSLNTHDNMRFKVRKVSLAIILQLKNEMPSVENPLVPVTVRLLPSSTSCIIPLSMVSSFLRTFRTDPGSASCRRPTPAPLLACSAGPEPQLQPTLRRIQSPQRAAPIGQPAPSPHLIGYRTASPAFSAPQVPAAVRPQLSGKWRERPLLNARHNRETLA